MKTDELAVTDDLAQMRGASLRTVLACLFATGYLWMLVLFIQTRQFGPPWFGLVTLAAGLVVATLAGTKRLSLAGAALILGVGGAVAHSMWRGDMETAPYVLTVVVSLASLLFGIGAVVYVMVLCCTLIVALGCFHFGFSFLSAEIVSPMAILGAVGLLSSLVVQNLYTALHWAWDRAVAAQRNEEALRDRQARLARSLKALEEAYQRLECLNYDLARAREVAEDARLIKQQFVTSVSHELRTPLNVVVSLSEMMYLSPERYGASSLPPAFRGDLREIYRSGKHLLHLIDDVLDMSQIEAGRLDISLESITLGDVVMETLDMVRPLVRDKDIVLGADLPAGLPPVLIDRDRVQQVLLNLLNNARRFTEQGRIIVQATHEGEQVWVTVADTGVGIPPDERENVFREFHQVVGAAARRRNGSGLGLAISKRFIEMHGGCIWVDSDGVPGLGSRFHFTLPVAGVEPVKLSALHGTRKLPQVTSDRGRELLVLDQDPAIVRMLEQGLEDYRVVPVNDVSQLPLLADELHIRAVVVNSAHRGRDARQMAELCRDARHELARLSLPVIFCPLVGEGQLGQALGVAGYLVKPVSREALTRHLDRLGESVRRVLVVDDDPRMVRLLSRMLQITMCEYEVIRAYNGQQALSEMRSRRPDLVLLDLVMPDVDGYAVLNRMREDPELRRIPVIVVTAQTRTPEKERRLGRKTVCISTEAGLTNQEAINYLRGILDAVPLRLSRQPVQHAE
jgi:signal transduction histidine kinase/CheY-like chemotaxis protein